MGPGILFVTRTADCVVVDTDVVTVVVAATVTTVDAVVRVGATEKGGNPEVAGHGRVDVESATPLRDPVDEEVVVDRETVDDETNSVAAASVLVMMLLCWDVSRRDRTPANSHASCSPSETHSSNGTVTQFVDGASSLVGEGIKLTSEPDELASHGSAREAHKDNSVSDISSWKNTSVVLDVALDELPNNTDWNYGELDHGDGSKGEFVEGAGAGVDVLN
ncbi:hypothetical protein QAD02_021792 [Eretmocerus hayati]|uniref:Uncharacterized protein n=1 Tax=Eretmocerus hayati TaxID=131215 RepID=A0ACC2PTQ3_9HYME|nr:hypothetical protein QAD02_021792 [Eretmocerus hayati]